jgi:hypothetical protein
MIGRTAGRRTLANVALPHHIKNVDDGQAIDDTYGVTVGLYRE